MAEELAQDIEVTGSQAIYLSWKGPIRITESDPLLSSPKGFEFLRHGKNIVKSFRHSLLTRF